MGDVINDNKRAMAYLGLSMEPRDEFGVEIVESLAVVSLMENISALEVISAISKNGNSATVRFWIEDAGIQGEILKSNSILDNRR